MITHKKNTWSFIAIMSIIINGAFGQSRIPADSVYQIIKSNSIYKNAVPWENIDLNYKSCIQTASGNPEILNCLVAVFEQLNDVSSSLIYKNQQYAYKPLTSDENINLIQALKERSKKEHGIIKTRLFKNKYTYIQVPDNTHSKDQINSFAQAISDSIHKYNNSRTKGYIVDLRLITNGQLASNLAGLHNLLGDGIIGGEIDENESTIRFWKMENGNFIRQGYSPTSISKSTNKLQLIPVVVLISGLTSGPGSLTAIAFKYRPKTSIIGEPTTNGFTTSTHLMRISNELSLNLAKEYVSDRLGNIYPYYVPPDIQILGGDNFDNLLQDKKIMMALRWFEKNKYY